MPPAGVSLTCHPKEDHLYSWTTADIPGWTRVGNVKENMVDQGRRGREGVGEWFGWSVCSRNDSIFSVYIGLHWSQNKCHEYKIVVGWDLVTCSMWSQRLFNWIGLSHNANGNPRRVTNERLEQIIGWNVEPEYAFQDVIQIWLNSLLCWPHSNKCFRCCKPDWKRNRPSELGMGIVNPDGLQNPMPVLFL